MHHHEREWRETRQVSRPYKKEKKSFPVVVWGGRALALMVLLITLVEVFKWTTVL